MALALEAGIRCFNVESAAELERLADVARAHGARAPVSFRINPDVDAGTHPYISTGLKENKFGVGMEDVLAVYRRASDLASIDVHGIDCHIGSQLTDIDPYRDALAPVVRDGRHARGRGHRAVARRRRRRARASATATRTRSTSRPGRAR